MNDCFARERELCLLFKRKNEAPGVCIDYSISNKSVDITVFHKEVNWDIEWGEKILNHLWKNFILAFIGYKTHCTILKYHHSENKNPITEYVFPMKSFNPENFHSPEFLNYCSDYPF